MPGRAGHRASRQRRPRGKGAGARPIIGTANPESEALRHAPNIARLSSARRPARGLGAGARRAAHPLGHAGPERLLGVPQHDAVATARGTGRPGGADTCRGGRVPHPAPRGDRPGARLAAQRRLVAARRPDRRADIVDRRSARRQAAAAHGGRGGAGAHARHRHPAAVGRRTGRPRTLRALHHGTDGAAARGLAEPARADFPDAGLRGHPARAELRPAHHPARRPAAARGHDPPVAGQLPRPMGRRHARRRDRRLQRRVDHPGQRTERALRRAHPVLRRRHPALRVHGGRPRLVRRPLDGDVPDHARHRAGVRERLPRGELQHAAHPARRARPGGRRP